MTPNGDIFRERIREVVQARIGDYLPNERNPKIHGELQNERLRAILENWGKVGVLLTFKDEDGRDVVFDGHARRNQNPDETWYIAKTDLTRQEANELVLMYDPIAALATMDRAAMDGLLREVQTTDAGLTKMLGELAADAGLYGSAIVPTPGEQSEPRLPTDHFIEIYCSSSDLNDFQDELTEWSERDSVTVNIS